MDEGRDAEEEKSAQGTQPSEQPTYVDPSIESARIAERYSGCGGDLAGCFTSLVELARAVAELFAYG